jgi:hypothetical protein
MWRHQTDVPSCPGCEFEPSGRPAGHYHEAVTRAELHELVDRLPDDAVEVAALFLARLRRGDIDPDQTWVWTPEWQDQLRSSIEDIAAGRTQRFGSDEEFLASL